MGAGLVTVLKSFPDRVDIETSTDDGIRRADATVHSADLGSAVRELTEACQRPAQDT